MDRRPLGSSGLHVSAIGMGCWAIGGIDWGPVNDEDSCEAIETALGEGVTLFDTADFYGLGHSEGVLARALGQRRAQVIVATKGGLRWDEGGANIRRDASPSWLTRAAEDSLRRLKTDWIDLYQLHWPDPAVPVEDSVGALQRLREAGKIRHVGVCNLSEDQLERVLTTGPVVSLQSPLSLLDPRGAALAARCQQLGVAFLAYSPLAMGLLTGKYVQEQVFSEGDVRGWLPHFRGETFRQNLARVESLRPIASGQGKTLAQLAVGWVLGQPGVSCALVGARNPDQVRENARGAGWALTPSAREKIARLLEPLHG